MTERKKKGSRNFNSGVSCPSNKAGTVYVKTELAKKASQSNVNTALALKADKFELTALNNKVKKLEATVGELQNKANALHLQLQKALHLLKRRQSV